MDRRDLYRPVAGWVPGRPIQVPVASADMDEGHVIDASDLIGVLTSFSKEEQSRRIELARPGLKQVGQAKLGLLKRMKPTRRDEPGDKALAHAEHVGERTALFLAVGEHGLGQADGVP